MAPEVSLFFHYSIIEAEVNFCPIFQGSGHRGRRGLQGWKGAAAFLAGGVGGGVGEGRDNERLCHLREYRVRG